MFIGLGANLNAPEQQIINALKALAKLPKTDLVNYSSLYASKPLGPKEQPDYVNAVAQLDTALSPLKLLKCLQHIEQHQGRVRKSERWGARTLDLDIILFGQHIIQSEELTVPHYHYQHREFVLYPLSELVPDLILPDGSSLASLLQKIHRNGLTLVRKQELVSIS